MTYRQTTDNRRWLLAIDTSTERAGIALTDGARVSELSWHAGRDQTVSVLAEIDHLLGLAGIAADDLAAIAVAIGPGMFNGLRVGVSIAKGFHLANGTPLLGVSTLGVTAEPFLTLGTTVVATVAAGRGRLVWTRFPDGEGPVNGSIDDLVTALRATAKPVVVAGDLDAAQVDRLLTVSGVGVPPLAVRERRPGVLAGIAWSRRQAGEHDDPILLAPVYVHSGARVGRG